MISIDKNTKKSKLRLVIITIFVSTIVITIFIALLLFLNTTPISEPAAAEIELISPVYNTAATSQEAATPSSEVYTSAEDYDSRFPKVPNNEMITDGWPHDVTFSRKYYITLCGELDHSNYKAVYIDLEKYLRVTKNGTVEVSYDQGVKWQTYETNIISTKDFLYWMAVHEAPGMSGYSVSEMIDRLENGAIVNHAAFSDGNDIYFVIDNNGVYLIFYMPNKIASVWIDGQRMAITPSLVISEKLVRAFYDLLISTGITTQDKAEQDYEDKMQKFRKDDSPFYIVE